MIKGNKRQFCRILITWLLASLIPCISVSSKHKQSVAQTITARILKVYPSPGVWTGVIESFQWTEVRVEKSSMPEINTGVILKLGVFLVAGNNLFDQNAQFSSDKISEGKLIRVDFSKKCVSPYPESSYLIDPGCIVMLK